MNNYIRDLAEALNEASADDGLTLGGTDAVICAAALRFLAAASEGVSAIQAATADLLAPPLSEAAV